MCGQRLLDNTPSAHRDYEQLQQAERTIHKLAVKINSVKESKHEEDLQETLKKLELLLITDVFTTCLIICLLLLLALRQTVHTHRASVHQAAKLVAALLTVAGATAGLAESNGSLLPGL